MKIFCSFRDDKLMFSINVIYLLQVSSSTNLQVIHL